MQFEAKLGVNYGGTHYIFIPVKKKYAEPFITPDSKRIICTLNNQERLHSALMPDGNGDYFININKEIRKKLRVEDGDILNVELAKDTSKYGMEMPEELEELLIQDEEGANYFQKLTPGKQRRLIWLVGKPKTSTTRLKKAVIIVDFLKTNRGKLDLLMLNEAFKR